LARWLRPAFWGDLELLIVNEMMNKKQTGIFKPVKGPQWPPSDCRPLTTFRRRFP
jgi:hypothetical protein